MRTSDGNASIAHLEDGVFDARLAIETPERVRLVHDLAGLGSRFAAGSIDTFFLILLWTGAAMVMMAFDFGGWLGADLNGAALAMAALGVFYLLLWVYFLGFELFRAGQTPGKWMLKLRVVSESGGPAPTSAIFVRNLVRLVDVMPVVVVHLLGGIVMFLHPRFMRIGDIAAGTVVVRERALSAGLLDLDQTAQRASGERHEDDLDDDEVALVRRFIERKHAFTRDALRDVAADVLATLKERRELPSADPVKLLTLLAQGHTPRELAEAAGPRAPQSPQTLDAPPSVSSDVDSVTDTQEPTA